MLTDIKLDKSANIISFNTRYIVDLLGVCSPIFEVIELDCNGVLRYTYYTKNGSGVLTPTVINDSNVLVECTSRHVETREACITVDGATDYLEVVRVDVRDSANGSIINTFYEDYFTGAVITGTIVEVCCGCESTCDEVFNRVCFSYGSLFNSKDIGGDIVLNGARVWLDYLEVDGSVVVSNKVSLGDTTAGFTAIDMGYGLGYNKIVDVLNNSTLISDSGAKFYTAANPNTPVTSPDPMGYGISRVSSNDIRMVITIEILPLGSSISNTYSIRLSEDSVNNFDALGNANDVGSWEASQLSSIQARGFVNCLNI